MCDLVQGYPKLFIYQNPDCVEDVEMFTLGAIVGGESCAFYMGNQGSFVRANDDIYFSNEILNDDGIPVYDEWALNNLFFDINSKGRLDRWAIKALCSSDTQVLNDDMKVFIQRISQKGMTVEKAMKDLYRSVTHKGLKKDSSAEQIQSQCVPATYVSIWDNGAKLIFPCKVNVDTREVFDIELEPDVLDDFEFFQGEMICLQDGKEYPIYGKSYLKPNDICFWYNDNDSLKVSAIDGKGKTSLSDQIQSASSRTAESHPTDKAPAKEFTTER